MSRRGTTTADGGVFQKPDPRSREVVKGAREDALGAEPREMKEGLKTQ